MKTKDNVKPLFVHVPEKEFKKYKVFAAANGLTLQALVRSSVNHFIKDVEEARAQRSKEGQ